MRHAVKTEGRRCNSAKVRRKKTRPRQMLEKSRNAVFFQWFVRRVSPKGLLKRRADSCGQRRNEKCWLSGRKKTGEGRRKGPRSLAFGEIKSDQWRNWKKRVVSGGPKKFSGQQTVFLASLFCLMFSLKISDEKWIPVRDAFVFFLWMSKSMLAMNRLAWEMTRSKKRTCPVFCWIFEAQRTQRFQKNWKIEWRLLLFVECRRRRDISCIWRCVLRRLGLGVVN